MERIEETDGNPANREVKAGLGGPIQTAGDSCLCVTIHQPVPVSGIAR
jgi:hypothetical protein